jgi:hypothetical protein
MIEGALRALNCRCVVVNFMHDAIALSLLFLLLLLIVGERLPNYDLGLLALLLRFYRDRVIHL